VSADRGSRRTSDKYETVRGSAGVPGLEGRDQREAYLFDDRGGAMGIDSGFGGGELGGERLVAKDAGDPAGEVVARAVVAQHARVAADELVFELREVGDDRTGGGVSIGTEIELAGGLDASLVVLVLVAQVRGASRLGGERDGVVGVRAPGQDGAAGRPFQEPGDLHWGHAGDCGGEVDETVGGMG
jgi:hypothetical protein